MDHGAGLPVDGHPPSADSLPKHCKTNDCGTAAGSRIRLDMNSTFVIGVSRKQGENAAQSFDLMIEQHSP